MKSIKKYWQNLNTSAVLSRFFVNNKLSSVFISQESRYFYLTLYNPQICSFWGWIKGGFKSEDTGKILCHQITTLSRKFE